MRWTGQLALIAALGGLGFGAWYGLDRGYYRITYGMTGPDGKVQEHVLNPRTFRMEPVVAQAQGPRRGPGAPPVVDVDRVRTGRVIETSEAVGTTRAFESITVSAKIAGIVEKINFQEGQRVKEGDVLLMLDAQERRADIQQADAEARRAVAQRDEIRTRLERALELRRSGAGTGAQVEDLTAQVKTLESAIASAEARRKAAEARLEDLIVRAPFAGRLGTRSVSLGAYVAPGARITTLDDLTRVRLDFAVPENLLGQLKVGQVVQARSAAFGERAFEGKVSVIDPRVDPLTRAVKLTADFENRDETLRPGMFMSVALQVTAKENAVVVPEEAVVSEGIRHLIFVVKDNKIERRIIRIGQRQDARIEVVEGVQPGETIVIRGVQRVRPGGEVVPKPIPEPQQSASPAKPEPVKPQADRRS